MTSPRWPDRYDDLPVNRHNAYRAGLERSDRALQTDGAEWRRLFDLAPDPYVVTDRTGLILEANQRAAATFTLPPRSRRRLVPRFTAACRSAVQQMLHDPDAHSEPIVVRLADNEQFRGELHCVPIGAERLLWLLRDVSEAERARDLLQDAADRERSAADRLRAVDSMRRSFLLAASHDLRGPLATVMVLASVLAETQLTREQRDQAINRLQFTAAQAMSLLDNLLDYERIDVAGAQFLLKSTDLGPIVEHAANSEPLNDHRLELCINPTRGNVDVALMERIVANLVGNAVQHTPLGSTIWVRFGAQHDGLLLAVEDNGPGIPRAKRRQVFELFHRGRESVGGLGVGLALVRRFAELHGGYARVEERVGGGSSFQVLFAGQPVIDPQD